ncbi:uncharacterized protein LOC110833399 isoform X2 [Zootermopsis nevadensis]|uniref:uncharacterized protein LOC110833399 isoform X2 n=1 Tax=Zootermopsis nevadensis TaxID=136037 RepID=UPI000B8E542B|nr:uncharacterized protein LOC110833399 isoform X2 [Zootermopsis nevadensis]
MNRASKMDNASNDLDNDLMKELECPVCLQYMKSPISMCQNGHSICNGCRSKLNNCFYCRQPFLKVRNLALENLSTVLLPPGLISKISDPSHKSYKCPFATISNEDCSWVGSLPDMRGHIKIIHTGGEDTQESGGRFNVILTDLSPERHYRKAVWIADELFYIVWEIKDGNFFCVVLCVGSKNKSSKFMYKFSLTAENEKKKISMCFQTRSVVQEIEQVLAPGHCVVLHFDTVLKFLNSDKCLSCDFEISPIEAESGADKNQPKTVTAKTVDRDSDSVRVKREFLREQKAPMKREFLDSRDDIPHETHRPGRHVGRGKVIWRGPRDRSVESHFQHISRDRDFRNRGGILGKHSNIGRSLTDLGNEAHYRDKETPAVVKMRDSVRLKINASSTSPAAKRETSDKLPKISLTSAKGMPRTEGAKLSELTKSQDKFQANDTKVISSSNFPVSKGLPRDERTKLSELGKSQDAVQSIYPKLESSHLSLMDDYQTTSVSPIDTFHDVVETNSSKVISNASVVRYTPSNQRTDLSQNTRTFPADNRPDSLTSPEETWKCFVCGQLAPKMLTNYFSLIDLAPPGTTWKCKLCCQWRA